MSDSETTSWSSLWYGWWRELPAADDSWPSIFCAVDSTWDISERAKVCQYLTEAPTVALEMCEDSCVLGGRRCDPGFRELSWNMIKTDGELFWRSDLAHYVRRHHVRVPEEMLSRMRMQSFVPPLESELEAYLPALQKSFEQLIREPSVRRNSSGHLRSRRKLSQVPPAPRIVIGRRITSGEHAADAARAALHTHGCPLEIPLVCLDQREFRADTLVWMTHATPKERLFLVRLCGMGRQAQIESPPAEITPRVWLLRTLLFKFHRVQLYLRLLGSERVGLLARDAAVRASAFVLSKFHSGTVRVQYVQWAGDCYAVGLRRDDPSLNPGHQCIEVRVDFLDGTIVAVF